MFYQLRFSPGNHVVEEDRQAIFINVLDSTQQITLDKLLQFLELFQVVVKRSQLKIKNVDELALVFVYLPVYFELGILLLKRNFGLLEEDGKVVAAQKHLACQIVVQLAH